MKPGFLSRALACALLLLLGACSGAGPIQYDRGKCLRDGAALSISQVEAEQSEVAHQLTSRQPWFAVITIGVALVAAAGNAEKLRLVLRARHQEGQKPIAELLRAAVDRQRETPLRFAVLVGGSLLLIAIGGGAYVYLDIEKRNNERALAALQFCHLAMRTQEEEGALDEQRHNLEAIESTAGDIRSLVDKLPPAEQRKAQTIVEQMNVALSKQGKLVGDYVERTNEAQKDLSAHTTAMEKGLASVQGDLAELRSLPANLKDLEGAARKIDQTTTSFDGRFADIRTSVADLNTKLDTLIARPACTPPPPPPPAKPAPAGSSAAESVKGPSAASAAPPPVSRDAGVATAKAH